MIEIVFHRREVRVMIEGTKNVDAKERMIAYLKKLMKLMEAEEN